MRNVSGLYFAYAVSFWPIFYATRKCTLCHPGILQKSSKENYHWGKSWVKCLEKSWLMMLPFCFCSNFEKLSLNNCVSITRTVEKSLFLEKQRAACRHWRISFSFEGCYFKAGYTLTHLCWWKFPSLSFGRIHFEFKGCWVVNFNLIKVLKVYFIHKQCKTWSDAAFRGVWSGFSLFADVP